MMIGHEFDAIEVHERVSKFWDMSSGFPIPRQKMKCPFCGGEPFIRWYRFFRTHYNLATIKHRADVSFKCPDCSVVWTHGVPIPENIFEVRGEKTWMWRDVLAHMKEHGFDLEGFYTPKPKKSTRGMRRSVSVE